MPPQINRDARRLRSLRNNYHNQVKRPVKIPRYLNNWVLLEEWLDVYWDGMYEDLENYLMNEDWYKVEMLMRARWDEHGIIVSALIPTHLLKLMRSKMDIEVSTEMHECTSIESAITVHENIGNPMGVRYIL